MRWLIVLAACANANEMSMNDLSMMSSSDLSSGVMRGFPSAAPWVCTNTSGAMTVYQKSRAHGFSPYASDASAGQRVVCYW
jgi:hypothetical protein